MNITELTEEELKRYQSQAEALASEYKVSKVHPVVMIDTDTNNRVACFLKEPNYLVKLRIMDKATTIGVYSAADELRDLSLIKEKSDPLTWGDGPECDRYKLGVTDYCLTLVNRFQNQFKKK